MKILNDYRLSIENTPDYKLWIKNHGFLSPDEYVERGLPWAISQYDYEKIAKDAINEFGNDFKSVLDGTKMWLKNNKGSCGCNIILIIENLKKYI